VLLYNQKVRTASVSFAVLMLLAACGRRIDTPEAVRQGVLDYLTTRSNLNMTAMNVDVTAVSFRQDEADATVSFTAKGSPAAKGMAIHYTLARKGGKWVVKDKAESGGNPHGAPGAAGSGAPGAVEGSLPPGHPAPAPQ
jgi:hypothetical protein